MTALALPPFLPRPPEDVRFTYALSFYAIVMSMFLLLLIELERFDSSWSVEDDSPLEVALGRPAVPPPTSLPLMFDFGTPSPFI